jgi:hypothetical protein
MLANNLRAITNINGKTAIDLLTDGIAGKVDLFTIVKNDVTIYFDHVELADCTSGQGLVEIVKEYAHKEPYYKYDIIQVPTDALKELWVNRKLESHHFDLLFLPPSDDYKLRTTINLKPIDLNDIYIDTKQATSTPQTKKRNSAPHILAIEAAIAELGKNALNEEIYNWIKKESQNPRNEHKYFMNCIDFHDPDIDPYSITIQTAIIFKYNGKPVRKQRFQDICNEKRK